MKLKMSKELQDFIIIHLIFIIACVLVILIPPSGYMGVKLFTLVIIYNIVIPLFGYLRHHSEWIKVWLFTFIISIFQIWPDWFLSAELGILEFPEDGFIKIGTVSLYMAGLWVIPLFIIIFTGLYLQEKVSNVAIYLIVALLSLIIFGSAEQTIWMLESWYPQNVTMIGNLAIYIIINRFNIVIIS